MLKMRPFSFQKAVLYIINIFNSIKKLEINFKFTGFYSPKSKANTVHVFILMLFLNQQHGPKVEEGTWKHNRLLYNSSEIFKHKILCVNS